MMEVFVTGASGLVGSRFVELYKSKYKFITPEYPEFDITDSIKTKAFIQKTSPDVLINFAAFTDVSLAEGQRNDKNGSCWKINVEGTRNLVEAVSAKTHFIQISTDMVFSGSEEKPGPYKEDDELELDSSKVTWYGFTKGQAEREVTRESKNLTILRFIYPVCAHYPQKLDYLRKPLSLFDQGKLYPMFDDQQISITFIDEIAETLGKIIDGNKTGIFHASSRDVSTPFELISYLLEKVRVQRMWSNEAL